MSLFALIYFTGERKDQETQNREINAPNTQFLTKDVKNMAKNEFIFSWRLFAFYPWKPVSGMMDEMLKTMAGY